MVPVAHRDDRALERENRRDPDPSASGQPQVHVVVLSGFSTLRGVFASHDLYYSGMHTRILAPLVLAGALALAACGGGDGDSSSSGTTLPADLTVTAIDGLAWDSTSYTATAGEVTIAVVNDSTLPHNLHIVDPSGTQLPEIFDIPAKGNVVSDTVTLAAGEYTLICTIPGHANMKATLTVS